MTGVARPQLTLDFEPTLPEQFPSLRAYVAFRVQEQRLNAIKLAGQMDLSPSVLSRKLNQPEGDSQRLNCDDLENYIRASGDVQSVIAYLAAKYMDDPAAKKTRLLNHVESLVPELLKAIASLKEAA
jgi:predicted transcriptional regulator